MSSLAPQTLIVESYSSWFLRMSDKWWTMEQRSMVRLPVAVQVRVKLKTIVS